MQRSDACLSCAACAIRRHATAQHQPSNSPLQILDCGVVIGDDLPQGYGPDSMRPRRNMVGVAG